MFFFFYIDIIIYITYLTSVYVCLADGLAAGYCSARSHLYTSRSLAVVFSMRKHTFRQHSRIVNLITYSTSKLLRLQLYYYNKLTMRSTRHLRPSIGHTFNQRNHINPYPRSISTSPENSHRTEPITHPPSYNSAYFQAEKPHQLTTRYYSLHCMTGACGRSMNLKQWVARQSI